MAESLSNEFCKGIDTGNKPRSFRNLNMQNVYATHEMVINMTVSVGRCLQAGRSSTRVAQKHFILLVPENLLSKHLMSRANRIWESVCCSIDGRTLCGFLISGPAGCGPPMSRPGPPKSLFWLSVSPRAVFYRPLLCACLHIAGFLFRGPRSVGEDEQRREFAALGWLWNTWLCLMSTVMCACGGKGVRGGRECGLH